MPFLIPLAVGTAATTAGVAGATTTVAATSGLIGTAGAVTAGGVASAAGMGLTALGQYRQGQAQEVWGEYNAAIAEQQAKAEAASSEAEAARFRKAGEKLKAEQRAAYAKARVTFAGSPMLVMEETEAQLKMDELDILRTGTIRKQKALSEATLSRMKGKSAYQAGVTGAGATLLAGVGDSYYKKNRRYPS